MSLPREPLKVGSLFSGIGGIDLGLEQAGMEVAWSCEIDKNARTVLAHRWPDVHCYDDVKEIDGSATRVDVLCGGFPCQDLSVAGKRAGLAGERSGLFHEFMRVAATLTPQWVLIENVPGLLSSEDGRDMGVVLGTLADLGYGWSYRVLDAQYFGVAQRRRRVFIVGCLGDGASAAEILFEPSSCDRDSPPRREARSVAAGGTAVSTLQGGGHGLRLDADSAAGGQLIPAREVANALGGVNGGQDFAVGKGDLLYSAPASSPLLSVRRGVPSSDEADTQLIAMTSTGHGWWTETTKAGTLSARDYKDAQTVVGYSIYPEGGQGADLVAREMTDEDAVPTITTTNASDRGTFVTGVPEGTATGVAIPLQDVREMDKSQNGLGVGGEDDPAYTMDTLGVQGVAYRKAKKAMDPDDWERWEETDASDTLASHGTTTALAIMTDPQAIDTYNAEIDGDITHTLRDGHGEGVPGLMSEMAVRRLTPMECERLQGFPDGWTDVLSDSGRYKTLGNAVAVPVARWIGEQIVKVTN